MIMLERGTKEVEFADLAKIPVPAQTESYQPVPYTEHISRLKDWADFQLKEYNYRLIGEQYAVARHGKRMIGMLQFQNGIEETLLIGTTNSYDKSCAIKVAAGAMVFVCSNLMITGDIVTMRKHTTNVYDDLDHIIIEAVKGGREAHIRANADAGFMKDVKCNDKHFYELMGIAFGEGIATPHQLNPIKAAWHKPPHNEFQPRNMWSAYNAFTEGLKSTPPHQVLERFDALHKLFMN